MGDTFSRQQYERLWRALVEMHPRGERTYFVYHKQRYFELFDRLATTLRERDAPLVLEVGVSGFTRLYKKLLPEIRLVTVDRPPALNGVSDTYTLQECAAERHYSLDLNRQPLDKEWGSPPLGQFDYVIFCEVLEHLVVHPVQLIHELLGLLKDDGYLYLTTPNFFSLGRLQQIANGDNPQAIPPRRGEDPDASHHFREYSMKELLQFAADAGGWVEQAHYSDCWDDERGRAALQSHPELRANLVLLIRRAELARSLAGPAEVPLATGLPAGAMSGESGPLGAAAEIARLKALLQAYEQGRFIRFARWWRQKGLPWPR
jgi:hypothetical protein